MTAEPSAWAKAQWHAICQEQEKAYGDVRTTFVASEAIMAAFDAAWRAGAETMWRRYIGYAGNMPIPVLTIPEPGEER